MNIVCIQYFNTPFGELILGSYGEMLCLCDWRYRKMRASIDERICRNLTAEYREESSSVVEEAISQLNEYFQKSRKEFDLQLLLAGTEFQKQVWEELLKIPFGRTTTYLELSRRLGNDLAIRAVAGANGANAISIIVPCHRVIGSNGELTGYAGGLTAKRKLLDLEGSQPDLFSSQED